MNARFEKLITYLDKLTILRGMGFECDDEIKECIESLRDDICVGEYLNTVVNTLLELLKEGEDPRELHRIYREVIYDLD